MNIESICDSCTTELGVLHNQTTLQYEIAVSELREIIHEATRSGDTYRAMILDTVLTDYRTHIIPACHPLAIN